MPDAVHPDDLVALTRDLVDVPSPTGSELACAEFLRAWLADRGVPARLQPVAPGRANVVATVEGTGRGPVLLLAGHLDTSYAGEVPIDYPGLGPTGPNQRPRSYVIDDGIYGLGAFNMKGGLAAAAAALVELGRGPRLSGDVVFAGLAGESEKAPVRGAVRPYLGEAHRGRGVGARRFLAEQARIDFVVVTGPSALRVVNAQAGSLFAVVTAIGRPAYLGRRVADEGALEVVAALVTELREWGARYRATHAMETGFGRLEPGLTLGAIDGGWPFAPNTSPAVCHLYLDLRVAPGQSPRAALNELRVAVAGFAAAHPSVALRVRPYAWGRGTLTEPGHPLVRAAVEVLERELGLPASPFPEGSADTSNDTNVFRGRGIPSIKLGPSDGLARDPSATRRHGLHVATGDLVAATRTYVALAHRMLGGPPA